MPAKLKAARTRATRHTDKFVGKSRQTCRSIVLVMKALKERFPLKTPTEIALRVGSGKPEDVRNAERWLAGTEPLAGVLIRLLQSDAGQDVLEAAMGDARPAWWIRFKKGSSIAAARAAIEAERRKLERLELELGQ